MYRKADLILGYETERELAISDEEEGEEEEGEEY